uniref:Enhancer of mRNA-decapping protein 4 WD40 repeat region domain-containing protein n=1 Tax=Romanomermis culicivorax TaxID=13658 RepID=A0A915HI51_ROMCU
MTFKFNVHSTGIDFYNATFMDTQDIYLEPNQDGASYALNSTHIEIKTCQKYETLLDSSKVKSTKLVDYGWEIKAYKGNLIAVHRDGDFLAYILHSTNRSGCAVRIFHRLTKYRALIKNFEGQATDLAWAFTSKPLYLGIMDEGGNLFVHNIAVENDEIKT